MMDSLLNKWQTELETMIAQISNLQTIDWQAYHFLRPEWFYGFIPLVLVLILMLKKQGKSQSWQKICDPELLPHILTTQQGKNSYLPAFITFIAVTLGITALAGPVATQLPQPVFREQSALVVLLDLSQSMDVQDIKPSRIERAKLELLDILAQRRGGQTALIVYAADAFTVTPLTDDNATIANLVPSLETSMMPAQGSNLDRALAKASDLFKQAGLNHGDILLITDDIHQRYKEIIQNTAANGQRVSIFGIGTEEGGPIPLSSGFLKDGNAAIVIPKLDTKKLQQMALAGQGLYVSITADDHDTVLLTDMFQSSRVDKSTGIKQNENNIQLSNINADVWREDGVWLLLPLLFFAALWARKGWLVVIIALSILPDPAPAYADDSIANSQAAGLMDNLWLTPDQRAMRAFEQGDNKKAANAFKQSNWKASALYRDGDFQQAAQLFDKNAQLTTENSPDSSDSFYNKGNALAKSGKYEEAISAYDKALELSADNEDANYNRNLVKEALKKQQEDQNKEQQEKGDKKKDQEDKKDGDKNQQENDDTEQQESDKSSDSESKDGKQQESDKQDGEPDDKQQEQQQEQQPSDEDKQAENSPEQKSDSEQQNKQQDEALKQRNPDDKDSQNKKQEQEKLEQEAAEPEDEKSSDDNNENNSEQEKEQPPQTQEINPREASVTEDQQAIEQWLRRVKDDPGGLLRRKFLYQYKAVPNQNDSEQPW